MTNRTGQPLRVTHHIRRVLPVLVAANAPLWGVDIAKRAGVPHSTARPVIVRLEEHGWVERTMQRRRGSSPRHLFALTRDGRIQAEALLKETAQ